MPRTALFTLPLLLALLAALALAVTAAPRPAAAQGFVQTPGLHLTPAPVAQDTRTAQRSKRGRRYDGRKIACRPSGCFRIPYGCYPTTEYDFWGNPTGFDAIVCPRRRRR